MATKKNTATKEILDLLERLLYVKGNSDEVEGAIGPANASGGLEYFACTLAESRWFKTLRGAERWMESRGYRRVAKTRCESCC